MFQSHKKVELGCRPCSPDSKDNTLPETETVLERQGMRSNKSQEGEKGCTRQKKKLKGILYSVNSQAMKKPQQHSPWIAIRDVSRRGRKRATDKSSTRLLQLPKLDPMMSPTFSTFSPLSPESTCHWHLLGWIG